MAAVLGLATAEVQAACDEASGPDGLAVPANLNAPDQTVISGDPAGVSRAGERCKARGAKRVIRAQGERRLPFTADGARGGRAAGGAGGGHLCRSRLSRSSPTPAAKRCGPASMPSGSWPISSPLRSAGWPACRPPPSWLPEPPSSRSGPGTCWPACSSASCRGPRRSRWGPRTR